MNPLQPGAQRGIAMAFVFVLVALLLLIAILVVAGAFNSASQAQAVGVKYAVLNSAEAAANLALNRLAENPNEPEGCVTGTMNGNAAYKSCLGSNNLPNPNPTTATDYANNQPILVPGHSAYIYGEGTYNNARKVYVEAIARPAPPLSMPAGAVNAAQNINDQAPEPIKQDPLSVNDADLFANNNIAVGGIPSSVQGVTHAVGTDSLAGSDGIKHSGWAPVYFPTPTQVQQAAQTAKLIAQAGTNVSGATVSSAGTAAYTGNVYVNGDVNITSGTITFTGGQNVYINGNLCVGGNATLLNADNLQGLMVVSGVVSSSGPHGYTITMPGNTMLLVLGNDPGAVNPCGTAATEAAWFAPSAGTEPVGTIYAANGSVGVGGAGTVQGALDGGINVNIVGGSGSSILYDANQANTRMPTGTMTYTAYNQD